MDNTTLVFIVNQFKELKAAKSRPEFWDYALDFRILLINYLRTSKETLDSDRLDRLNNLCLSKDKEGLIKFISEVLNDTIKSLYPRVYIHFMKNQYVNSTIYYSPYTDFTESISFIESYFSLGKIAIDTHPDQVTNNTKNLKSYKWDMLLDDDLIDYKVQIELKDASLCINEEYTKSSLTDIKADKLISSMIKDWIDTMRRDLNLLEDFYQQITTSLR